MVTVERAFPDPAGAASNDLRAEELSRARAVAASVCDPELPELTIADLGMLKDIAIDASGAVQVTILPTYMGCPAMGLIRLEIETALARAGFDRAEVHLAWHPAWSTDMMTPAAHEKLKLLGIAPPGPARGKRALFAADEPVGCPRCGSTATRKISEFGSTACKAHWRCDACAEPFDQFKCI